MVAFAITLSGAVGLLLSAGFIIWEVGHYATPQVRENRFDERREIFAYTAGLFVGVPLVLPWLLFLVAFTNGGLLGTVVFLLSLVVLMEVAQRVLGRIRYWGATPSYPFYALGFRCGIAGILVLALVGQYLSSPTITADGLAVILLQSVALVMLGATGALLSIRAPANSGRGGGGMVAGGIVSFLGLFLLGFNVFAGELIGAIAALLALGIAVFLYSQLRISLKKIRPLPAPGPAPGGAAAGRFARTDRDEPPPGGSS